MLDNRSCMSTFRKMSFVRKDNFRVINPYLDRTRMLYGIRKIFSAKWLVCCSYLPFSLRLNDCVIFLCPLSKQVTVTCSFQILYCSSFTHIHWASLRRICRFFFTKTLVTFCPRSRLMSLKLVYRIVSQPVQSISSFSIENQ